MPQIYVGTYAKYNNGSIDGAWLDLDDYDDKDEFIKACQELHADENDPELMFQDWEEIPDGFISESHIDPEFWGYMNHQGDDGAKAAYMACFGEWDSDQFDERYRGQYEGWQEMAEEFIEECGILNQIPENLRYYFDYEAYARDMRLGGDMCEDNGHFFWNH